MAVLTEEQTMLRDAAKGWTQDSAPVAALRKLRDGAIDAASAVEWHVVELDRCASDMLEALRSSVRYLVGRGYSRARA